MQYTIYNLYSKYLGKYIMFKNYELKNKQIKTPKMYTPSGWAHTIHLNTKYMIKVE